MTRQRGSRSGGDQRSDEWWGSLGEFFDENVRVYLRLSALAARMHGSGPLSGPRRTVLLSLSRTGPQTVAHMARQREQSRQRFQPLVNALVADGLVRARPNAAHRHSPLIALTPRGRTVVQRIQRVEAAWRLRLDIDVSKARLDDTVDLMRQVRSALEDVLHG
jgi:DNA-binding MarR family transcriptional regulator